MEGPLLVAVEAVSAEGILSKEGPAGRWGSPMAATAVLTPGFGKGGSKVTKEAEHRFMLGLALALEAELVVIVLVGTMVDIMGATMVETVVVILMDTGVLWLQEEDAMMILVDATDRVVERMEVAIQTSLVEFVAGMLNLPVEVVVVSRR